MKFKKWLLENNFALVHSNPSWGSPVRQSLINDKEYFERGIRSNWVSYMKSGKKKKKKKSNSN